MDFALGFFFAGFIGLICIILLQEDPIHEDEDEI